MPRFFFHIRDDLDVPDLEGLDLDDLAAARECAQRYARALMCETLIDDGRITLTHRIDIEDEAHAVVASVPFGETLTIER